MTATESPAQTKPVRSRPNTNLAGTVTANVLKALGTPEGYIKTKATNVFENRWRVDIWVATPTVLHCAIQKAHISDSFFLIVDDSGTITNTEIVKKY